MKLEILRIVSVGPNTIGANDIHSFDLIYSYLLQKFDQYFYKLIQINHINNDELQELIMKESGNKIYINIRYPINGEFQSKSANEKYNIRLDIIHSALLRIAEYDKKLNPVILEEIRAEILEKDFNFEIECKTFQNKKNTALLGRILVNPQIDKFILYCVVEEKGRQICKEVIYIGITEILFFDYFFCKGAWKGNTLIISGQEKIVETHVHVDQCKVECINLTPYENPPLYTGMRADIPKEQRDKAWDDWHHSLPPARAAMLRDAHN